MKRSAADLVRDCCAESLMALKTYHGRAIKLQAEPIHQMRVGTRRLRALLRVFGSIMDAHWASELEAELRWLAHLLGNVRDLDVMRQRLREAAKPQDHRALLYLQRVLGKRHRNAQAAMREGLRSKRYDDLIERLHASSLAPEVLLEAGKPALEVLIPSLQSAWRTLSRAARKLKPDDNSLKFHRVRKMAKRTRYAAEMLMEDLAQDNRDDAKRFIKRMKKLQDNLGELQDSVVASKTIEMLLELNATHRASLHRIMKTQERAEKKARSKFSKAWAAANKKKNREWMK
jgi:CHAD domain-containing protein